MKNTLFVLLFSVFSILLQAEPVCHFRHFSTDDGLPQYTIMDILQDKNGFMWFGTWDGLSKFDGYKFRNYKVKPEDNYFMKSNRVERMYDDKYGRIWLRSYDGEIHCFDPDARKFRGTQLIPELSEIGFVAERIEIKPSGKVWLFSAEKGVVVVEDALFNTKFYNTHTANIKTDVINTVFEDREGNSWLLTNNGLSFINEKTKDIKSYFYENDTRSANEKQAFFSAIDAGNIMMFGSQNGRIWQYSKNDGKFTLLTAPTLSAISKFIILDNDKMAIVTQTDGFILFNRFENKFNIYNTSTLPLLKSNKIGETFLVKNRYLWFDTDEVGIYRFDVKTKEIKYFRVETDDAATIVFPPRTMVFEDIAGRLWIQPKGGGFSLYNEQTNTLEPFFNSHKSGEWRFSNIIHTAYSDLQGNLWICTRSNGLEKIVFDKNYFNAKQINNEKNSVIANDVRCIYQDSKKNLWIATKDRRLSVYDKSGKKLGSMSATGNIEPDAYFPSMVYSLLEDDENNLWIGTKGGGLYCLCKPQAGKKAILLHFENNPNDVYSLSDKSIYSVFQDSRKNIWVGTYGGGLNLIRKNSNGSISFINHRNNLKNYPVETGLRIRFITENSQRKICLGTTAGLLMFSSSFNVPENIEFKLYSRHPGNAEHILSNDVHGICITRKGEMYIAAFGGGISKVTKLDKQGFPLSFRNYTANEGLPSDVTLAIMEDEFGKLWISSENNLTRFDTEKEVFENFAEVKRLMSSYSFSEASTCRLWNNDLVFGFSNGIVQFSPRRIINSTYKPSIVFSNLQLFNKNVEIGQKNSPLQKDINGIEELKLKHNQNFITIEFAALDYVDPENILYAYKLDGLDQNWNYVQKQRVANYTNLPRGKYVFRVKSTNSEGVWLDNERSLRIEVLPSFWQTVWAYLLYLLIFAALIFAVVRILYTIYRLRGNVELEKKMSEMKLRFFTDISHEIRTPLTMITAPVDYLMNDDKTPDNIRKHLKTISQNTNRMLRLVNQILDFRKIQFLHLKVQEIEIASFVENICDTFSEISENQHIKFKFSNKVSDEKVWVDPDCLEKIIMNLLSNAFKFSPPGKSIEVLLFSDEKTVSVSVTDHGSGMSKEKQKNLFVRFASFNDDKSKPSTGIGLSMVKELADKHSAKVAVESEVGKGSTFTVSFLKGISHFDKNVEILAANEAENKQIEIIDKSTIKPIEAEDLSMRKDGKYSVLIVEDDTELRNFICSIIENEYQVYLADDGKSGWEMAQKYCPDFVVSDIMMPEMNGIELLQKLKTNRNTSHIPVVLLTAKTTIESKLEGMAYGADDYITKPFSVPYFQARISNLIQQRLQLQEIFRESLVPNTSTVANSREYFPQPALITSQDEIFMSKVMKTIEDNMENFDFTVEELGQNMMMSRSVFFKKIKALTGLAPVEFIRDIKMKRAAQILASGQYMVKEVAYLIGISDTKYFAKCFKSKYGVTPMEFKNIKNQKNNP